MPDNRGIYRKYNVTRTDGRDASGEKHHGCAYFVIDLDHDENAKVALKAYADSCRETRPLLAKHLDYLCSLEFGETEYSASCAMDLLMDRAEKEAPHG